jgi:hypothetical protein
MTEVVPPFAHRTQQRHKPHRFPFILTAIPGSYAIHTHAPRTATTADRRTWKPYRGRVRISVGGGRPQILWIPREPRLPYRSGA